jgi:putative addiction module killer protein
MKAASDGGLCVARWLFYGCVAFALHFWRYVIASAEQYRGHVGTNAARTAKLRIVSWSFSLDDWLNGLRDAKGQVIIETRLDRLSQGNFGLCKAVGEGVLELKIHFGPGYRVYLAEDGPRIVLLLVGGDKATQEKDIKVAKRYWLEYRETRS